MKQKLSNKLLLIIILILIISFIIIFVKAINNILKDTPEEQEKFVNAKIVDNAIANNPDVYTNNKTKAQRNNIVFNKVDKWNNYIDGISCINTYNHAIENLLNEENGNNSNDVIEDPSSKILSILSENYISEEKITEDNVKDLATGKYQYVALESYYSEQNNYIFLTYGYLINKDTDESKNYGYLVQMNYITNAFELIPYEGLDSRGIKNIQEGKEYIIESGTIVQNRGNRFSPITLNDNIITNNILNQFKYNSLYKPEVAFKQLDSEYAKKFGNEEGFKTYVSQNYRKIKAIEISSIEVKEKKGEYLVYRCKNTSYDTFYIQYNEEDCSKILIKFSNIIL